MSPLFVRTLNTKLTILRKTLQGQLRLLAKSPSGLDSIVKIFMKHTYMKLDQVRTQFRRRDKICKIIEMKGKIALIFPYPTLFEPFFVTEIGVNR